MEKVKKIDKKKIFLAIGIIVILLVAVGLVVVLTNNDKKPNVAVGETSFSDPYKTTQELKNYSMDLDIKVSDTENLKYNFKIDNDYQDIIETRTKGEEVLQSHYFVDYANNELYFVSDLGVSSGTMEYIDNILKIYEVIDTNSSKKKISDNEYEYVISNLEVYNRVLTSLNALYSFDNINFDDFSSDLTVTIKTEKDYVSSISYQIKGITFNYTLSNYNNSEKLSIPEKFVVEVPVDENGAFLPVEDE